MDSDCRNGKPNTVGFYLLPTDLIQTILLRLCIPEIIHMKLVSKCIFSTISDQNFIRACNSRSESTAWLFVFTRRWRRDGVLHGFSDRSTHWFKIPIIGLLKQVIYPGEDFYFLTASGNFFLFASSYHLGIIAVNLVKKTAKRIPPSPLGPRGTSSLRRSGMKLLTGSVGSVHFRFMFVETVDNRPVLFEYASRTDTWWSSEAEEGGVYRGSSHQVFLNVSNGPRESTVIAAVETQPAVLRPRFDGGAIGERRLAVGFSRGDLDNQLLIYGDGFVTIIRSDVINLGIKKIVSIEIWGMSPNCEKWEFVSRVPKELIMKIKKPCGVIMGCLERRLGIIRLVLMSNLEGLWDIIWLNYNLERYHWDWISLPDCKFAKGSNMAGITFSSGLTLS